MWSYIHSHWFLMMPEVLADLNIRLAVLRTLTWNSGNPRWSVSNIHYFMKILQGERTSMQSLSVIDTPRVWIHLILGWFDRPSLQAEHGTLFERQINCFWWHIEVGIWSHRMVVTTSHGLQTIRMQIRVQIRAQVWQSAPELRTIGWRANYQSDLIIGITSSSTRNSALTCAAHLPKT